MDNPIFFNQSRSCESLGGDGEKKTKNTYKGKDRLPFKKERLFCNNQPVHDDDRRLIIATTST